jgi:MraZ protein
MGEYRHTVDGKMRLFIPAKFRTGDTKKNTSFVVTRGLDGCLYLYLRDEWNSIAGKFKNLSIKNKIAERAFKRAMLSGASEVCVDSQGRVLLPRHLLQEAAINDDVVIIGVMDHAEIWSLKKWVKYKKYADASFKRLAPHLEL